MYIKVGLPDYSWPYLAAWKDGSDVSPDRSFQKNMAAVDIDVPVDTDSKIHSPEELER